MQVRTSRHCHSRFARPLSKKRRALVSRDVELVEQDWRARSIAQGSFPHRRAGAPGPCFVSPGFAGQPSLNSSVLGE